MIVIPSKSLGIIEPLFDTGGNDAVPFYNVADDELIVLVAIALRFWSHEVLDGSKGNKGITRIIGRRGLSSSAKHRGTSCHASDHFSNLFMVEWKKETDR